MMYVLGFGVVEETCVLFCPCLNLPQSNHNRVVLIAREDSGCAQNLGMRTARREFVAQQLLIKRKRPLPLLEFGIERLPEPARPHLHFLTSCGCFSRARERAGSP